MDNFISERFFLFDGHWAHYDPSSDAPIGQLLSRYGLACSNDKPDFVEWIDLPFYKGCKLLRIASLASDGLFPAYFVLTPEAKSLHYLNGSSEPIHYINKYIGVDLTNNNIQQYLQFFCFFVQGDVGSFHIISSEDHPLVDGNVKAKFTFDVVLKKITGEESTQTSGKGCLISSVPEERKDEKGWTLEAIILYGNAFFQAQFFVYQSGFVEMIKDNPLSSIEGNLPEYSFPKIEELTEEREQQTDGKNGQSVQIFDYSELKREQAIADREHQHHLKVYLSRLEQNKGEFAFKRYDGSLEDFEEIITLLNTEFPQMQEVNTFIRETMIFNILFRQGEIAIPAILLGGPEATGKSRYIQRLSELLSLPRKVLDFATTSAAFVIAGASRIWKSGQPGLMADTFSKHQLANPLIAIEELDKSLGNEQYCAMNTLYTLLEANSAKEFVDEYLNVSINCQYINWIATCNSTGTIPSPIRSRFKFFYIQKPNRIQRAKIVHSVYLHLLNELHIAPFFSPELPDAVVSCIAAQSQDLRDMKQLVRQALVKACVRSNRNAKMDRSTIDKIEITLFDCKPDCDSATSELRRTELTH